MLLFSALRYRNYRLFFAGQAFANLGKMMKQVALGWLVYRLTDSAFLLGLVSFSREFAAFLVASVAGVVADRVNKHQLLIGMHSLITLNALLLGYCTFTGNVNISLLLVFQLIFGCLSGMEMPSRQAFVNDLVQDKAQLSHAIALNSTLFNTTRIVGPSVAGILIPLVGEAWCFLLYALMSFCIVCFFLLIRYRPEAIRRTRLRFKAEFREGFDYAFRFPPIRILLLFVAAVSLLGVPYIVILPVFANKILGGDAILFGYMTSAIGIGSVAGAVYLGSKSRVIGLDKMMFIAALVFSISLTFFAVSEAVWLSLCLLALTGAGRVIIFAGSNTLLQTLSEDGKRGRVLSLYIMIYMGSLMVGNLLIGALAEWISAPYTLCAFGVACLLASLVFGRSLKTSRFIMYRRLKVV